MGKKQNAPAKETKKETKEKPKYNMWQISAYMVSLAWREKEKKIIL